MEKQTRRDRVAAVTNGLVGLEVESHRVTPAGQLSPEPYPSRLADQQHHHFIKNDFLQTQSELITPATTSTRKALMYLGDYQQTLRGVLQTDEALWPYSMPPALKADHSDIVIAKTDPESYEYRLRVATRRKIERTAECGVHVNLGLSDEGLKALGLDAGPALAESRNRLYLQAAVGFYQYRWLLTTLFGATPTAFANYFSEDTTVPSHLVRSLRNSPYGYGNGVAGSYESVAAYVARIESAVASGDLLADREFYGIVRLKGGHELADLLTQGIGYIELRTLDLDPFEPLGIGAKAINFIRLLFGYFVMGTQLPDDIDGTIATGEQHNAISALESPFALSHQLPSGLDLLDELQVFYEGVRLPFNAQALIEQMRERLLNPALTSAARLSTMAKHDILFKSLQRFAHDYQVDLENRPLLGFEAASQDQQAHVYERLRAGEPVALPESQLVEY